MSGAADQIPEKALRLARGVAGAAGCTEVCRLLEAAAAHLHDASTGGEAGAYLIVLEARRLAAGHRSTPQVQEALLDILDVTLAVIYHAPPEPVAPKAGA